MRTRFYLLNLCLLLSTLLRPQSLAAQTIDNPGFEGNYSPLPVDPSCPAIQGEIALGWLDNICRERKLDGTMHDLRAGAAIMLTATPLRLEAAINEDSGAFLPLVTAGGRQP